MTDSHHPKLTAGELAHIWEQYMNNCMASVVLDYFQSTVDSPDIRSLYVEAIAMVDSDKNQIANLFQQDNYPLPKGFSKEDLNPNASKMFTDEFALFYIQNMEKIDLTLTALALCDSARGDIRKLFTERMQKAMGLYDKAVGLLLEKGLFVRPPLISSTNESPSETNDGFMGNLFGVGPRTLTAREANEIHKTIFLNYLGKCMLMAFHQSSNHPKLKELLLRGKELATKIMREFRDVMLENDLPVATTWDTAVLDSQISPFSDQLIAFHVDQMNRFGLVNYGYGAAKSSRRDLKALFARTTVETLQYEDDLRSLMIENDWLETSPVALDRRSLSKV